MITSNSGTDWTNIMSAEDKKEFLKDPEFASWLKGLLSDRNQSTTVHFTKKDGTSRAMRCTRNPELIPQEFHPKGEGESTKSIAAFDLDKNEWRSFIPENVVRIEYEF